MKLIILGSGTSVPLTYRASPSIVLIKNDRCILFDIGPGTLRQLAKIGYDHHQIDQIFLSHFHPDHTADLIHFLFATRYPADLKKRDPFTITGPKGLREFLTNLQTAYSKWLDVPPEIMLLEELDNQSPDQKIYNDLNISTQPVKHTERSLAYRVEMENSKNFVYSGDTDYCEEIITISKKSDLLILESAFPEGQKTKGHLTPSLAGKIASLAGVKKLLLVHFYPATLASNITDDCRKTYAGELILARDLLSVSI